MEMDRKTAAAMIALGALARLAPHPWNFTPMVAIGLFAGAKSAKARTGVLVTLGALLVSDAAMGFYRGMWYVYAATLIAVAMGRWVRNRESVARIAGGAAAASVSFFIATNFAVWALGLTYAHTFAGLAACFAAAVPFYQNQVLGDAFYTAALFGGYALVQRWAAARLRIA